MVRLVSFEDEYYPSGAPKDYRAQVELLVGGQVVQEGLIRVNYPLNYNGLKIYQFSFGPAVNLLATGADGQELFRGPVALSNSFRDEQGIVRSYGILEHPENNLFVVIVGSAGPGDPSVPAGQVSIQLYDGPFPDSQQIGFSNAAAGAAVEIQGVKFNPEALTQFSVFQLREDPGLGMIWVAFALFMIGLGMVFYFPHRQVIVAVHPDIKGSRVSYSFLGKKGQAAEEIQAFGQAIGATGQIQPKTIERKSKR